MNTNRSITGLSLILFAIAPIWGASGRAVLAPTGGASGPAGLVHFEDTRTGLRVRAEVWNAPPGKRGFHIHAFGACDDKGRAAGDHYNPRGTPHGHIHRNGARHAHMGDMGNILVGEDGRGTLEIEIRRASLSGRFPVAGRAVILHGEEDDYSQPLGNAGPRIACGPIVLTGP